MRIDTGMKITLSRIPLGIALCLATLGPRPNVTGALLLAVFAVADLADGIVARGQGRDTPMRRAVDSVVDRATICVFFTLLPLGGGYQALIALLWCTNLLLAADASRDLRFGIVHQAPHWHKVWSGTFGTAGVALLLHLPLAEVLFALGMVLHTACSVDLTLRRLRLPTRGVGRRGFTRPTQLVQL